MAKKTTTSELIKSIEKRGIIEEREILLLKKRANAGDKEAARWCPENIRVTEEQTAKGLTWLINKWKTPRGIERKNNPFGYREEDILENFDHFELAGFYNASNYRAFYVPLYDVCAKDGRHFEYYVWGGEVQIVG